MADRVSRMASGALSASFMILLMNFLAWNPGRTVVSRVKIDLLSSLGNVTWAGPGCNESWAAGKWRDNSDIKVRGRTVLTKEEIHACVFDLAVHHTREGWNGLLIV